MGSQPGKKQIQIKRAFRNVNEGNFRSDLSTKIGMDMDG